MGDPLMPPSLARVDEALAAVAELVEREPVVLHYSDADRRDDERDYFRMHRPRFGKRSAGWCGGSPPARGFWTWGRTFYTWRWRYAGWGTR